MRKSWWIGGWILLVGAGCETIPGRGGQSERLEMTGLEDMSLAYIKTKWGEPETNVTKGDGRVVHFKNIRSEDENPISRKISVKYCDVRLDVNREMLVKTWAYENCKPATAGK